MQTSGEKVSKAVLKHLRSSAQKTRLVINQIRGLDVNRALAQLNESPKAVARDVSKVLRSAVANAQNGDQRVDADTLFVSGAWVDAGPMLKRIRPATFGRAFQILKRSCHVTVELESRPDAGPRVSRAKRRAQAAREARKQASLGAAGKTDETKSEEVKKKSKAGAKTASPGKKNAGSGAKRSAAAKPKTGNQGRGNR
jgi:large subunit ribosomal protein L22